MTLDLARHTNTHKLPPNRGALKDSPVIRLGISGACFRGPAGLFRISGTFKLSNGEVYLTPRQRKLAVTFGGKD